MELHLHSSYTFMTLHLNKQTASTALPKLLDGTEVNQEKRP